MKEKLSYYDSEMFHDIMTILCEEQQFTSISDVLASISDEAMCDPSPKTLKYLRDNLQFCFEPSVRVNLQQGIDNFERIYTNFQSKEFKAAYVPKLQNLGYFDDLDEEEKAFVIKMSGSGTSSYSRQGQEFENNDQIDGEMVNIKGQKDKKMLRKKARFERDDDSGELPEDLDELEISF